ncbi:unnamed protein product [Cuscuta campestris]|uniref:Uncharacterized protein n=1 Tax=Cuscuta campestris TaxID=132261 RepID=A0A484KZ36_9ASTE|nr:unnamed protein product [Cuscuta campestris]
MRRPVAADAQTRRCRFSDLPLPMPRYAAAAAWIRRRHFSTSFSLSSPTACVSTTTDEATVLYSWIHSSAPPLHPLFFY